MINFETMYDAMVQSIQDNEICDIHFLEVLHAPDFIALVKGLCGDSDNADKEKIYSSCVLYGFRLCELQKACFLLKGELYDGTGNLFPLFEKNSEKDEFEIKGISSIVKNEETLEEKYFYVGLYSEEEVCCKPRNWIQLRSNYFVVNSIVDELASIFNFIVDEFGVLTFSAINKFGDIWACDDRIDLNKIVIKNESNEIRLYSDDVDRLGCLYYLICTYTDKLNLLVNQENCLQEMRLLIKGLNNFCKDISVDKVILNNNIISKFTEAGIYRLCDILYKKLINILYDELKEVVNAIKQVETSMPKQLFDNWLNCLSPKEYYVIYNRYLNGDIMTLETVGNHCNVSRERVRQVERTAISVLLSRNRSNLRNLFINQLKLFSPHKSYITMSEIENIGLTPNVAIFLDKVTGDVLYDCEFHAAFFSRASKYKLDKCFEELPSEFTVNDLQDYSLLMSEETNGLFSQQDICDLVGEKCRKYGIYFSKGKITLRVVLSVLMQKYFPNGMDVHEDKNIEFLRKRAITEFNGFELAENNRAISAYLLRICVPVDRGIWKLDKDIILISDELKSLIIDYIDAYNSPVLPIQAILEKFAEQLKDVGIYNRYSLHGQLKKILSMNYTINRDYIYKSNGCSIYEVIEAFIKQAAMPVTKRDIQTNFPGVTDIVIQQTAYVTKVLNMNGYYIHLDNFNVTSNERDLFKSLLDKELADKQIHHSSTVFEAIKSRLSGLFGRIGVTHYLQFHYLMREMFPDDYEYNRPFIGALGVNLVSGEAQVISRILKQDECDISTIRQYAREVGTIVDRYIEFIDRNNDSFIFKNRKSVISTAAAGIDDVDWSELDIILSDFMDKEEYRLLSDFCNFRELPDLRCPWNTWLLYSVVKKYSIKFKVVLTSRYLNVAKPILIHRDYDEHNIDFAAIDKLDNGDTDQFDENNDDIFDVFDYDDLE